jgi:septin family protein
MKKLIIIMLLVASNVGAIPVLEEVYPDCSTIKGVRAKASCEVKENTRRLIKEQEEKNRIKEEERRMAEQKQIEQEEKARFEKEQFEKKVENQEQEMEELKKLIMELQLKVIELIKLLIERGVVPEIVA